MFFGVMKHRSLKTLHMSRHRNQRWERHDTRGQDQPRDEQGRFTDRFDADRNRHRSDNYRENPGRDYHWSNEDRGYGRENDYRGNSNQEYRSQYFSGREDYPGPGRSQGFGTGRRHDYGDWTNTNFNQNTTSRAHRRITDRAFGQQQYRTERPNREYYVGEYGYGSGRTEMPDRQTWNRREDESYNWGEHSGEERAGIHRGKGPKGYKRSDERIREEINERLSDDDQVDASEIVVSVSEGEVSLGGTVSDRASKRRAEDIVEEIYGVTNVENRIRIGRVTPEEPVGSERAKRETANGRTKVPQTS
jgi:osmotically-inducible protein OsmY